MLIDKLFKPPLPGGRTHKLIILGIDNTGLVLHIFGNFLNVYRCRYISSAMADKYTYSRHTISFIPDPSL